jgi:hypothetical protein
VSVKANWFSDALDEAASSIDPFACHAEQLGLEIDLRRPEDLHEQLHELMRREQELYDKRVTCSIKDRADTSCAACPVRHTDALDRLTPLCDVGVEMERVTTTLAVHAIEPERPESGLTAG